MSGTGSSGSPPSAPGAYLRVLPEGVVGAGDPVEVVSRPCERVTVAESMPRTTATPS